ncbi:hypothetical protein IEE94_04290 [Yimella sp. cx-573]|nr:hypothetical protein [Yimella sp. cx-573]
MAPKRVIGVGGLALLIALVTVVLTACWHLTQSTSDVAVPDVLAAMFGHGDQRTLDTLTGSRLPRMCAAVLTAVQQMAPVVVIGLLAAFALSGRLDLLGMGDAASSPRHRYRPGSWSR